MLVDEVERGKAWRVGGEGGGVGYELVEVEGLPETIADNVGLCFEK